MPQNPPIPGHHGKLFLLPRKKPYIKPSFCPIFVPSCPNRGRHSLVSFSVVLLCEVSFCEWLCGIPCLPTVGIPFPSELQHLHGGRGGLSPQSCNALSSITRWTCKGKMWPIHKMKYHSSLNRRNSSYAIIMAEPVSLWVRQRRPNIM